ncbi:inner centromere protein isoform X2 [Tachyglossus aculeatus]|uniref:inner centromere protein isoform X2 n=1 Tax=Tachyglossus aculeatus TaxID=9261 RepID=UPI0018F4E51E|nr:inner centromere protein isoform X2 [Tachyglossus aculeatus]
METTKELMSLFEVSNNKLMKFLLNVENRDLVWLQEIEQEAMKMFSSDFNTEPELMPKTPSQKNRRKKKRFPSIQDENRDPTRKRLSKKRNRRQSSTKRRQSKEELNKLTLALAGENAPSPRVTRSKAALLPESPTVPIPKPKNVLLPFVEISNSVRRSAELYLKAQMARLEDSPGVIEIVAEDVASPKEQGGERLESVTGASLAGLPEAPEKKAAGEGRAASKLKIAKAGPSPPAALPGVPPGGAADGCPRSPERGWDPEAEPAPDGAETPQTPTGSRSNRRSVRRSLVGRPSQAQRGRTSLAEKYSLVAKRESGIRRSISRSTSKKKAARESAVANRVVCHSYLERLLHKDVPAQARAEEEPGEEPEPAKEAEKEEPEGTRRTLRSRTANKIAISTPKAQLEASDKEDSPSKKEQLQEPPQTVRRKRSYKQAVDDLYDGQQPEDDEPSPPKSKAPSPPYLASKVVRPHKTFLHTVQRNQLLMTPTSVSRSSGIKSFIKRNTPQRVDPKEKERQRLENLRKKNEAEEQRKLKVEEEKRKRLEEMKLKREERLRKVLQARERVEQLEEEKKKRIEQKFAQNNEKAKEERQAEEKAKKKIAAKKMEEAEARRRQEEEARKLKWLQQEEEERRYQEQKKREEEQEKARKIAEAKKLAEQRQVELERERERQRQREQQLAMERELERRREQERIQAERERERQEKERTLRLQKERLQKELEEKKKREEQQRLAEQERQQQEQERKRKLQEEQEKKAKEEQEKKAKEEQEKKAKESEATAAAGHKGLNVTIEVQSPVCNSYQMTPQGPKVPKLPKINPNNYGMDLNSDDSTDDESHPRKPIPAWASGTLLSQAVIRQYYHPPDVDQMFGFISNPKLEDIFYQNKPKYHKRTSSAIWHSPPLQGTRSALGLKKY